MRHLVPETSDRKPSNCPLMNFYGNTLQGLFLCDIFLDLLLLLTFCLLLVSFSLIIFHPVGHRLVSVLLWLCCFRLINPGTWLSFFLPSSRFLSASSWLSLFKSATLAHTITCSYPASLCTAVFFRLCLGPALGSGHTAPSSDAMPCSASELLRSAQAWHAKPTGKSHTHTPQGLQLVTFQLKSPFKIPNRSCVWRVCEVMRQSGFVQAKMLWGRLILW